MAGEWLTEFERTILSSGIAISIFAMILYNWLIDPVLSRLINRVPLFASPAGKNTEEAIMAEAREMLEGWYAIRKNGEIVFTPPTEARIDSFLEHSRKPVLYLFAAKDAYDMGKRNTPQVSDFELVEHSIPYDWEFLVLNPRLDFINSYECEAVELESGKEVVVCEGVDEVVFESLERNCEILQNNEVDCNEEAVVVDCGKKDGTSIPQFVFELNGTKAVNAAEYLK